MKRIAVLLLAVSAAACGGLKKSGPPRVFGSRTGEAPEPRAESREERREEGKGPRAVVSAGTLELWVPVEDAKKGWSWNRTETGDGELEYAWIAHFDMAPNEYQLGMVVRKKGAPASGGLAQLIQAGETGLWKGGRAIQGGGRTTAAADGDGILLELRDPAFYALLEGYRPASLGLEVVNPEDGASRTTVELRYK